MTGKLAMALVIFGLVTVVVDKGILALAGALFGPNTLHVANVAGAFCGALTAIAYYQRSRWPTHQVDTNDET